MKNKFNRKKPSITIRFFLMSAYGILAIFVLYLEVTTIFPALVSGSIDSLSFEGKGNSYIAIGYKALFQHIVMLIIGVGSLVLSIEQLKIIRNKWRQS